MAAASRILLAIGLTALAPVASAQTAPEPLVDPPTTYPAPPPATAPAVDPEALSALEAKLAAMAARVDQLEAAAAAAASPEPEAATDPSSPPRVPVAPSDPDGFRFGSYGRVIAGTDLDGGKPEPIHVVAHGPRIVEATYLELDFAYRYRFAEHGTIRTVTTLAFGDDLFHDTGDFGAAPAIRNLYAETTVGTLSAWVGSRMYRGDDLYLFDFWPLDDLNTVGGGLAKTISLDDVHAQTVTVAVHAGVNRLLVPFQYQERTVAQPELGTTTVVQLNRQRMITSLRADYARIPIDGSMGYRARLYGELHALPSGNRQRGDATLEYLPDDWGTTIGAEVSVWQQPGTTGRSRHANLFARWSKGLAAFDELAAPTSFDAELKTFSAASELVFGLGSNWDAAWGHVTSAAYARRFVDADRNLQDRDDGWEYALDVRPAAKLRGGLHAALDLAYEARFPRGLQPTTQLAADPAIVSIAPMLTYAPTGPSAFDRPELRLVYRAAHQNPGALALYPSTDPRAVAWTHFLGVEAEWWFNSNSYR